jgi:hypothetical protein
MVGLGGRFVHPLLGGRSLGGRDQFVMSTMKENPTTR